MTRAGPSVKIVRIETKETPATVYNFEVADTHSYFVGGAKQSGTVLGGTRSGGGWIWVYNDCDLIGVPKDAFDRMAARFKGLNIGGDKFVNEMHVFGSRAGSLFRGRGPKPGSDLDVMLRIRNDFYSKRGAGKSKKLLREITDDFTAETGIKIDLNINLVSFYVDNPVFRQS